MWLMQSNKKSFEIYVTTIASSFFSFCLKVAEFLFENVFKNPKILDYNLFIYLNI